jgi:hypothetical protein
LAGSGDDAFIRLAVDHDLPFSGTNRLSTGLQGAHGLAFFAVEVFAFGGFFPDRQAPLFEKVNAVVHEAAQVEDQVFANQTHEVVADHADVVFGGMLSPTYVLMAERPWATAPERSMAALSHSRTRLIVLQPFLHFESRTAGSHTTADDEDIDFFLDHFWVPNGLKFTLGFVR